MKKYIQKAMEFWKITVARVKMMDASGHSWHWGGCRIHGRHLQLHAWAGGLKLKIFHCQLSRWNMTTGELFLYGTKTMVDNHHLGCAHDMGICLVFGTVRLNIFGLPWMLSIKILWLPMPGPGRFGPLCCQRCLQVGIVQPRHGQRGAHDQQRTCRKQKKWIKKSTTSQACEFNATRWTTKKHQKAVT